MLFDVLEENLVLVICGTAIAEHSAKVGSYYAGGGNKFWPTLHTAGITVRCLHSNEYRELLQYRVGLTDLVKKVAGTDNRLTEDDFDLDAFRAKNEGYSPQVVCFNGKKAAEVYLRKKVNYGLQLDTIGRTQLFVAPSTSGAANRYWDISVWQQLGGKVKRIREQRR